MVWQGDKSQPLIVPTTQNRSVQVLLRNILSYCVKRRYAILTRGGRPM